MRDFLQRDFVQVMSYECLFALVVLGVLWLLIGCLAKKCNRRFYRRFLLLIMSFYGGWWAVDIYCLYSFGYTSIPWRETICRLFQPPDDILDPILQIPLCPSKCRYVGILHHKYDARYCLGIGDGENFYGGGDMLEFEVSIVADNGRCCWKNDFRIGRTANGGSQFCCVGYSVPREVLPRTNLRIIVDLKGDVESLVRRKPDSMIFVRAVSNL